MALPATQTFTLINYGYVEVLLSNWSVAITSNGLFCDYPADRGIRSWVANTYSCAYWNADTFSDDQYVEANYNLGINFYYIGPAVRCSGSGSGSCYFMGVNNNYQGLFRLNNQTATLLGSAGSYSTQLDDTLYIEADGTTISANINGTDWSESVTDATYSSGSAGVAGYGEQGSGIDTWEGGDLATGTEVTPTTAALTITEYAPTVTATANVTATPSVASLTITEYAPAVSTPVVCTPGVASLTTSLKAPDVSASKNVSAVPGVASLTLTTYLPTVSTSDTQEVTPDPATLTLTGYAPTVSASDAVEVTPGVAALTLAGLAPTVSTSDAVEVTPGVASLTLSNFAPTVSTPRTVTPGVASLSLTGYAPTITADASIVCTPTTQGLTVTAYAPTIATSGNVTVTPGLAPLEITTYAPSAASPGIYEPGVASLTLTPFAPTVSTPDPQVATPSVLSLSTSAFAPTISTTTNTVARPGEAKLVLTSYAPSIESNAGSEVIEDGEWTGTATFQAGDQWYIVLEGAAVQDPSAVVVVQFRGVT
jgi:hypothetical protein